jgi:pimeloyl-ACP methyl ester carboxylesterase
LQQFTSNGVEIAYRDEGDGDPILLVHGFASNSTVNWESTGWIGTLVGDGRRVVAMDVRGHGRSAKLYDPAQYVPALMAEDAANLLDHLSLPSADVMGYSMGARIAAFLALDRGLMVRSLICGGMGLGLVEGIGGADEIVAALEADDSAGIVSDVGRAYRKFAELTGSDLRALAACMRAQRELIPVERLAGIRVPTLVAVGSKDDVAGSGAELAALIPGAAFLDIPGRDHLLATGDKAFKAGVLDFLRHRP